MPPGSNRPCRRERRTRRYGRDRGVARLVRDPACCSGTCHLYVPHTTAGVTINENADPDVALDIATALERLVPQSAEYRHAEGNSDSHVKAALVGSSATVFIDRRPTRARPLAGDFLLRVRWATTAGVAR